MSGDKVKAALAMRDALIRRQRGETVRYKVIHTGQAIYEVYRYSDGNSFNPSTGCRIAVRDRKLKASSLTETKALSTKRPNNLTRARNEFRRLVNANFTSDSYFVTLTYRQNITDIDKAFYDLKQYIRKLRKKYGEVAYIAVREYQKRGAIHFHMLVNIDINHDNQLGTLWGHGWVTCLSLTSRNKGTEVDNVGAYLSKYMTKSVDDEEKGRKAYFSSRGLAKPIVFRGSDSLELLEMLSLEQKRPVYHNTYESKYSGRVVYAEYNLDRFNEIGPTNFIKHIGGDGNGRS